MNAPRQHRSGGFTIIEVMLFLGISAALMVGILAASSLSINTQRYRDAITTFQATLQQQYNLTSNVTTDRSGTAEVCYSTSIDAGPTVRNPTPIGTSECVVLGRYIAIARDGMSMRMANLVGYKDPRLPVSESLGELQTLQQYNIFIDRSSIRTAQVPWGGTARLESGTGEGQSFIIVIARSPITGTIRTFSYNGQDTNTVDKTQLVNASQNQERRICVNPATFNVGSKLGIVIRPYASGAGAVELMTEENPCEV